MAMAMGSGGAMEGESRGDRGAGGAEVRPHGAGEDGDAGPAEAGTAEAGEGTEFGLFGMLPELGVIEGVLALLPDSELVSLRAVCRDFRRLLPYFHVEYRWNRLMRTPGPVVKHFNSHTREYEAVESEDGVDPFQLCAMLDRMGSLGHDAAPLIPRILVYCDSDGSSEYVRWSAVRAVCGIALATIEDALGRACRLVTPSSRRLYNRHLAAAAPQIRGCLVRCMDDAFYKIRQEALERMHALARLERAYEQFKATKAAVDCGFDDPCPLSLRGGSLVDELRERAGAMSRCDAHAAVRKAAARLLDVLEEQEEQEEQEGGDGGGGA